jgi:trk system potassium uptake protein TrkH
VRGRFASYIAGTGLLAISAVLLLFVGYALLASEPWTGFATAVLSATPLGLALMYFGSSETEPSRREAIVGVLLLWLLIPAVGAIPFVVSGGFSVLNGLFESMSGFTTTGATVLRNFSSFSSSLFMWRALTQWIGGVGIIVLFIAVFPQLAIAGRQLFFAEAPGPTEDQFTPRLRNTASAVLQVYVALTALCCIAYIIGGMTPYHALAHAFTTLAAGGFSPLGLSFEEFRSPSLDWIATVFMVFAGANFALQFRALVGRPGELLRDAEFRTYIVVILVAGAALTAILLPTYGGWDAPRHAFFQTVSILTTTGYASVDFALWDARAHMVLLILMFIGGSAGSAAGGVKIVRWLIIAAQAGREVRQSLHPCGAFTVRVGSRLVPNPVIRAVSAFLTLYLGLLGLSTLILTVFGADLLTAFTASIACIGNIGPGLGAVGPMANFADLHPVSRGVLVFDMYAGRLEIVTVFVILLPGWWRLPKRRFNLIAN